MDMHYLSEICWLCFGGRVMEQVFMPVSPILMVCELQGEYVKHRWRGGGAGERGREEWCGRGWTNGPSVCSERLSGRTRNLPGTHWLTGRHDTPQRRRWRSAPSPQMNLGRVGGERPAVNRRRPKRKLRNNSSRSRVWGWKQISHIEKRWEDGVRNVTVING